MNQERFEEAQKEWDEQDERAKVNLMQAYLRCCQYIGFAATDAFLLTYSKDLSTKSPQYNF